MCKVIRSNTEVAITPPLKLLSCSIALKFRTEFDHGISAILQMFKVKGQKSRSQGQRLRLQRNVMFQQQKRYKVAMDRLSNFKLGMAS